MRKLKKLYLEYLSEARKLHSYIDELKVKRSFMRDVDEIKNITKRIELLDTEYSELIRDAGLIRNYLKDDDLSELVDEILKEVC